VGEQLGIHWRRSPLLGRKPAPAPGFTPGACPTRPLFSSRIIFARCECAALATRIQRLPSLRLVIVNNHSWNCLQPHSLLLTFDSCSIFTSPSCILQSFYLTDHRHPLGLTHVPRLAPLHRIGISRRPLRHTTAIIGATGAVTTPPAVPLIFFRCDRP
jgi:hypothetical protein